MGRASNSKRTVLSRSSMSCVTVGCTMSREGRFGSTRTTVVAR
jgi:hypothetical protein